MRHALWTGCLRLLLLGAFLFSVGGCAQEQRVAPKADDGTVHMKVSKQTWLRNMKFSFVWLKLEVRGHNP